MQHSPFANDIYQIENDDIPPLNFNPSNTTFYQSSKPI